MCDFSNLDNTELYDLRTLLAKMMEKSQFCGDHPNQLYVSETWALVSTEIDQREWEPPSSVGPVRIVGWDGEGTCDCGQPSSAILLDEYSTETWEVCKEHTPTDVPDDVADAFQRSFGSFQD